MTLAKMRPYVNCGRGSPRSRATCAARAVARGDVVTDDDPAIPWVNMLALHAGGSSAPCRGADIVLRTRSTAIPGGLPLARRPLYGSLATPQPLLRRVACRQGRSIPPAGRGSTKPHRPAGSRRAWQRLAIEARGGFVEAHDFLGQIAECAPPAAPTTSLHRRLAITGVNEYPNWANPRCRPVIRHRQCAATLPGFEALRDRSITT